MPQDNDQVTPTTDPVMPADNITTQASQPMADDVQAQPPIDPAPSATTPDQPTDSASAPIDPASAPIDPTPISADPTPVTPVDTPISPLFQDIPASARPQSEIQATVVTRISEAKNVLIALSSDPSVDEMAAAIGLSLFLDQIGKRATAIYSGSTPNALEFLKPEETFESTADTLQDFVIALNKEKADHLRYKLDGDYVKVYITPYRHRISEEDLEFSYGDYNVDLVLALDVANGIDLDAALREHGRIMHDAVIINITTGNPGKFGEIEWSDKAASSVSEMIADLLYSFGGDNQIDKDEATAFLTGIVAATNRFSNAKTTPFTMQIASKLMESGANQQLVAKNITPDIDNELINLNMSNAVSEEGNKPYDPTKLDIEHDYEKRAQGTEEGSDSESASDYTADKVEEINADVTKKEHTLLDDLKAAEESLAQAGAETTPVDNHTAIKIDSGSLSDTLPTVSIPDESTDITSDTTPSDSTLDDISSISPSSISDNESSASSSSASDNESSISSNPASDNAPSVPSNPEINGVPEMNYMPLPGQDILPPPPTPPIDMSQGSTDGALPTPPAEPIQPATPSVEPEPTPLGPQPAMQDQVYVPQAADPSAFKIPGA